MVNVKLLFFFQRPPPVLDALGRVISEQPPDQWEARLEDALPLDDVNTTLILLSRSLFAVFMWDHLVHGV